MSPSGDLILAQGPKELSRCPHLRWSEVCPVRNGILCPSVEWCAVTAPSAETAGSSGISKVFMEEGKVCVRVGSGRLLLPRT